MKLNIFCVPENHKAWLQEKLEQVGATRISSVEYDDWKGDFYFSTDNEGSAISWLEPYLSYFPDGVPTNTNHFAAFIFSRNGRCYVLSHGKAHFYIRQFAEIDFGVELAKRIANETDIRQTSSRRFAGRRKKDIRSFTPNTRLDVESGESVDFLQAGCIRTARPVFGSSGKFGTSALLTPDMLVSDIGEKLTAVDAELAKEPRFRLPRTTVIADESTVRRYDERLIDEIISNRDSVDFVQSSYDLYGVDFVFPDEGRYGLRCPGYPEIAIEVPTIEALREYVVEKKLPRHEILRTRLVHHPDDRGTYSVDLKNSLDFIYDEDQVILSAGKWMHFNQDYLDFLDEYIDGIRVEDTEDKYKVIRTTEPEFNSSLAEPHSGYEVADKNFDIFKTRSATPIEAWDLRRESCVYAVKFGTAQKLGYVVDQASAVLELLRNRADVKKVPDFNQYCLWLGYAGRQPLDRLSRSRSIILKQKVEVWARRATELRIEPVLKLSHRPK